MNPIVVVSLALWFVMIATVTFCVWRAYGINKEAKRYELRQELIQELKGEELVAEIELFLAETEEGSAGI